MREKWETLSLTVLRDIAKGIGVKGYSTMKKDDLVTLLVEEEEKKNKAAAASKPAAEKSEPSEKSAPAEKNAPAEKSAPAEKKAVPEKKESDEKDEEMAELDSKIPACGILEVMPDSVGIQEATAEWMKNLIRLKDLPDTVSLTCILENGEQLIFPVQVR